MQIYSKIPVKQGRVILLDKLTYQVQSCIDLEWLYKGEKTGYILQLKEVNVLTEEKEWLDHLFF